MKFNIKSNVFEFFYLVVFLLAIYPYLKTGFYNDDSINSYLYADVLIKGQSIYEFTITSLKSWIQESGRFFPLTVISGNYLWYYIFKHLEVYRFLSFLAVLMNLSLFAYFLKLLKKSTSFIRTFLLVILILFQLRIYHDPIASYGLIYQVILAIALVPSILLIRFAETRAYKYLIGACLVYLIGIFFYEMSLIWILVYIWVIYFNLEPRPKTLKDIVRQAWKPCVGFFTIIASYGVLMTSIRMMYPRNYTGTKLNISTKFFSAIFNQILGAFPFTSFVFDSPEQDYLPYKLLHQKPFLMIADRLVGLEGRCIVLLLISSVLFFLVFKQFAQRRENQLSYKIKEKHLYLLSVIFIVAPAILISLSEKYQQEVSYPTYPYLPVYLSYFGVALGFTLILEWILRKIGRRKWIIIGIGCVLGLALTLNTVINEVECERLNLISKYPRELFLESLHLGLLDQVSEDSVIFHGRAHPYDTVWINTAIAYAELGKALKFQALDDLSNERLKQETMFGKSVYFLQWYSDNLDYQWIVRHQLKNIDGLSVLDKSVVFIHSVSVPEKVYLEDSLGNHVIVESKFIQTIKKKWYRLETSGVNLDWVSTRVLKE